MSNDAITVDMSRLYRLIREIGPKERRKLLRGSLKASANKLKKRAFEILKPKLKTIRNPRALKREIRTKVYKRITGFGVSVAGNKNLYPSRMKNRRGEVREVPLARWLEAGTYTRKTRDKGYGRGFINAYKFMQQAEREMAPGLIRTIETEVIKKLQKKAKEYE